MPHPGVPTTAEIAVFGSSEPLPGQELYDQARELGRSLAGAGHTVVTGGYGGVMEGACRGAREAGGRTVGVTCEIFSHRQPNPYIDLEVPTRDLHERTQVLIERAGGFVVLHGKAGTLAEVAFLWALDRARCLDGRPVVLLGDRWQPWLTNLVQTRMLDPDQVEKTRLASSPSDAVHLLRRH